jgi:hypothetical protein
MPYHRLNVATWLSCAALGGIGLLVTLTGPVMAGGEDIASQIASRLNWPSSAGVVRPATLDGLHGCNIYDAYDRRVLDGASVAIARLSDGGLIASTDPQAVQTVLSRCTLASTPGATLAELLARFSQNPGPLRVLHNNSDVTARILLRRSGQTFAPPKAVRDRKVLRIRFLGLSEDGTDLYRVEGRVTHDGVSIQAERLAP